MRSLLGRGTVTERYGGLRADLQSARSRALLAAAGSPASLVALPSSASIAVLAITARRPSVSAGISPLRTHSYALDREMPSNSATSGTVKVRRDGT
jgi:hypothetical protein